MKLSLYCGVSKIIRERGWEAAAKEALSLGCNMLETIDTPFSSEEPVLSSIEQVREARKVLNFHGVSISCCSVFANLYNSPETVSFLKSYSELAYELGSPFLHHTLLPWIEPSAEVPKAEEAIEKIIDAAEEIANHAANFGITCLYEGQGLIVNGIEGYHKFFDEMKRRCKNVGVCGDIGNTLFVDVSPKDFFSEFISDIKHVHVKEYKRFPYTEERKPGWMRTHNGSYISDVPLGTGICEIDECMKILKAAGYDDVVSIESTDPPPAVGYMKNTYNSIFK